MSSNQPVQSISSPAATGSGGGYYEQNVNAYFLALLLIGGIPPVLTDCTVSEVSFQTEQLGWDTDDILVIGMKSDGMKRKLIGQAKRSFTIGKNEECVKTITDFWKDFGGGQFDAAFDRLLIIAPFGSANLKYFSSLLDCARTSLSGDDFARRLNTKGLLHGKANEYFKQIREIVSDSEGRAVSSAELLPFLSVLYFVQLDFTSDSGQAESQIKSVLANLCSDEDSIAAAGATWNELLRLSGLGAPKGQILQLHSFRQELRERHPASSPATQKLIEKLGDHSKTILDGICSKLGSSVHIRRELLRQRVADDLTSQKVVIISGQSGSGKSALAKSVIEDFQADSLTVCFRAEEFARPHIDETLQLAKIDISSAKLATVLAGPYRKIVLVESVERLLEKPQREAFGDLLNFIRQEPGWQLILTCRDYSTGLIKTALLEQFSISHSVIEVPPLSEAEQLEAVEKIPALSIPLANAKLAKLLLNPYFLDKAIKMNWSASTLPETERDFRKCFWVDVIRASDRTAGGMPIRREEVFMTIAIRRARALSMYADCADLDPEARQLLLQDSLIQVGKSSLSFVAPAHDVLEDWAILQWLEVEYEKCENSLAKLSDSIQTHPAIRRSYRKWIQELVESNRLIANELFKELLAETDIPQHFSDDTLVSFLMSSKASDFLIRHAEALFENEKVLLRRIFHLLRVACVAPINHSSGSATQPSIFNVPDREAWECVLKLVSSRIQEFKNDDFLLLGFIEDWSRSLNWQSPHASEKIEHAGKIAYHLFDAKDTYENDELRLRSLKVIARIPLANKDRFLEILTKEAQVSGRSTMKNYLQKLIFEDLEGATACRALPNEVISAFREYLFRNEVAHHSRFEIEEPPTSLNSEAMFGIRRRKHELGFHPASAYKGPFIHLLNSNRQYGLSFILELLNVCCESYKQNYVKAGLTLDEITLTFANGISVQQVCNESLWNMYRGASVTPDVLQCALMALEHWLLVIARVEEDALDDLLLEILQRSTNVATSGVVASIATAYPHQCVAALLVLAKSPACILLDRGRLIHSQRSAALNEVLSGFQRHNKIFSDERLNSDKLPHRKYDLERAVLELQLGLHHTSVEAIIDQHLLELPESEKEDEYHQVWRLALHRMDLRQHDVRQVPSNSATGQSYLLITGKEPAKDLQKVVSKATKQTGRMNDLVKFQMWGEHVFRGIDGESFDPNEWKEKLAEASKISFRSLIDPANWARRGASSIAAVCIRDHWDELKKSEQGWCIETVCSDIDRTSRKWNLLEREQRGAPEGVFAAAWVLPSLLKKNLSKAQHERVLNSLILALTHPLDDVRFHACGGVGTHLTKTDKALSIRCANALAAESIMLEESLTKNARIPYQKQKLLQTLEIDAAKTIRKEFFNDQVVSLDSCRNLDLNRDFDRVALSRVLNILEDLPDESIAIETFERVSKLFSENWNKDRLLNEKDMLMKPLVRFLFVCPEEKVNNIMRPLLDSIDLHPRELFWIVVEFTFIEMEKGTTFRFWKLWEMVADRILKSSWLESLNNGRSIGEDLITSIFLSAYRKEDSGHWQSLEGHAHKLDSLYQRLPACSVVLGAYVSFLSTIGEQSLPNGFVLICDSLKKGNTRKMLVQQENNIFLLERLLSKHVYGKTTELKQTERRRGSVLYLLDQLVECGSSAAYKMRDDFVTPMG